MKSRFLMTLCAAVFSVSALAMTVFRGNSQITTDKNHDSQVDFNKFPLVDFSASEPSDAAARARRSKKSKKYNNKSQPEVSEIDVTFLVNEQLSNLPALPAEKSSVVLVGEIVSAKAYISEDKTSVYSEFEVRIEIIFKNKSNQALSPKGTVAVERFGGRVRLPSGKVVIAAVDNQDMPRVGSRYVLFLSNDFFGAKHNDEDFNILMGYELKAGKVFPLDVTSSKHPIARYNKADELTLMTDLSSALVNPSPTLRN